MEPRFARSARNLASQGSFPRRVMSLSLSSFILHGGEMELTMEKLQSVSFNCVSIDGGFWQKRQELNAKTTLYAVYKRFQETGRFDALRCDWNEQKPYKPHIFWDSDVAKWIEAVAYSITHRPDPELERVADEAIEQIAAHQREDGYFNIWFTAVEPEQRWQRRTDHELYCAGHLMEAAVAYYYATHKDTLLRVVCRYADYIYRVFYQEHAAAFSTPGHEEIELALVKLFRCTREARYLELSQYFVDMRGTCDQDKHYPWANPRYAQDHLPVRQQTTAEGHAVRATYLYSAMADLAYQCGDEELYAACVKLFENITERRMYITGGIGSSHKGEAFTIDYHLPNLSAYSESCAAIGLAMFARRLGRLRVDARYADTVERILYNNFLSSESLDGKAFFYENPLEIDPRLHHADASVGDGTTRYPITQRKEIFDCSCCPPNIARFLASLGDYLYNWGGDTVYVHQYINSTTVFDLEDRDAVLVQRTNYPIEGEVQIKATGLSGRQLAVRIPGWCQNWRIEQNGQPAQCTVQSGYAYLPVGSHEETFTLWFDLTPQLIEANPAVQEDAGRVAVQRGPVVYCLEGVDNGEGLRDIALPRDVTFTEEPDETTGLPALIAEGTRRSWGDAGLYRPLGTQPSPQRLRFIPYFAFANRGESEMLVWVGLR